VIRGLATVMLAGEDPCVLRVVMNDTGPRPLKRPAVACQDADAVL